MTPKSGEAAASLAEVSHRYGSTAALSDVSLIVPAGRMVGLIGPDGIGKSTLLGLVAGVRRIQSGLVETLGSSIGNAAYRRRIISRIAYMPQGLGRNLYPTLSVQENVDFFGRLYGQSETERAWRIDDLLTNTGLDPFRARPAGKLSGGMKQKLSLCCSLIHDPDLLILDEPTTGVDPLSRKQFWELIERIRQRRQAMSVITATAYMSEAEEFDHLIAMDDGRVLATGRAEELKQRTGTATLEEAFIALLPEEKRAGHHEIHLPPREIGEGVPAIEAEGLTMRFGDFTAVDKVSFRIETGEIFGFLGSNGCGKTTTMKMLTGLLPPTEGTAKLFGEMVKSGDLATRRRVGYMSQAFSLYSELTVRQNLELHADLFQITGAQRSARIAELLTQFDLEDAAASRPQSLPLGVKQRLQLAVAVLHRPEMLILDEPTSGVDPVARDGFWELLIDLSRKDGVTIFISTHFMNEAERCDRISLMHAGQVLAVGRPDDLRVEAGAETLEQAFIGYLEEAAGLDTAGDDVPAAEQPQTPEPAVAAVSDSSAWGFSPSRTWAIARREGLELLRDPIRLAFALFGPIILMLAMGFGISFDVENVNYAVLDRDRSAESRLFLQQFSGSRYFNEVPEIVSADRLDKRMAGGEFTVAIEIPSNFGRNLRSGHVTEISVWLDGSNTTRAETARGYVEGAFSSFLGELTRAQPGAMQSVMPVTVESRFRYNQAFRSVYAIPPGILMLLLMIIPAMLTALGVVREKEIGSITNLYAAPAKKFEFLLGKQLPYVAVGFVSFLSLVVLMRTVFGTPMDGSFLALASGATLYIVAATAFGLVVSTFVGSQIAAIFATTIIVTIPTVNFSGMIYPTATLEGGARIMGESFPALYFQKISAGVFNKSLGLADLYQNHIMLALFCVGFWVLATLLLRKQEA